MPSLYSGPGLVADALAAASASIPKGLMESEQVIPDIINKTQHGVFERQWQPLRLAQGQTQIDLGRQELAHREQMGPLQFDRLKQQLDAARAAEEHQTFMRPYAVRGAGIEEQINREKARFLPTQHEITLEKNLREGKEFSWKELDERRKQEMLTDLPRRIETFMASPKVPGVVKDAIRLFSSSPQLQAKIIDDWIKQETHKFAPPAPHTSDLTWLMSLDPARRDEAIKAYRGLHPGAVGGPMGQQERWRFNAARDEIRGRLGRLSQLVGIGAEQLKRLPPNPATGRTWTEAEVQIAIRSAEQEMAKLVADFRALGGDPNEAAAARPAGGMPALPLELLR